MTHRVGTTRWTAPEVLNYGDPHYSTKADVYSFGIVLYVRVFSFLKLHSFANE